MADESYPDDLRYHPEHDWARVDGDTATFGVTWYAQDALGEVVFYEPPDVGKEVKKDEAYAEVESVKAVSDVYAPLSGEVTEVNSALAENPEKINQDPYGEGWMVKVKLSDPSEADALMDAAAYKKLLEDRLLSHGPSSTSRSIAGQPLRFQPSDEARSQPRVSAADGLYRFQSNRTEVKR